MQLSLGEGRTLKIEARLNRVFYINFDTRGEPAAIRIDGPSFSIVHRKSGARLPKGWAEIPDLSTHDTVSFQIKLEHALSLAVCR